MYPSSLFVLSPVLSRKRFLPLTFELC
jgi:hypothetical protein